MSVLRTRGSKKRCSRLSRSEMSNAIRELQNEFDKRLDYQNQQMQSYYQMKVQEVKTGQAKDASKVEHLITETKRLQSIINDMRSQISDLEGRNALLERQYADLLRQHEEDLRTWDEDKNRYELDIARLTAEIEKLLREMEAVMDSKLSLELEIAAYRKLLEVEENRLSMLDQQEYVTQTHVQQAEATKDYNMFAQQAIMTGQMSQKTTFQRSAKGPLAISQVDPAGHWIEVENTGRKEENVGGWKVGRKVDGKGMISFTFPENLTLGNTKDSRSIKIYAKDKGPVGSLEYERDNWGTGSQVATTLISPAGEDKATHIQKTTYAQ